MFKFDTCDDAWLRMNIEDCYELLGAYMLRRKIPCPICTRRKCRPTERGGRSLCVWYVMTGRTCSRTQSTTVTQPKLRRNRIQQLRRWIKAMELELERRREDV